LAALGTVAAQNPKVDDIHKVPPALQTKIDAAVENGAAYLKNAQTQNGTWNRDRGETEGVTALAAWTLLESGVPASDRAIQKAAEVLRQAAVRETKNYHISLMIFFFDKLGDPEDIPLIESLAARLMAGQLSDAGWNYQSPAAPDQQRLQGLVGNRKGNGGKVALPRTFQQLSPAIQQQLQGLRLGKTAGVSDNSNTQFAMLALWVARRYGIPADSSLAATGKRFWTTQGQDGGWGYHGSGGMPGSGAFAPQGAQVPPGGFKLPNVGGPDAFEMMRSPSMTPVGLIGIALGVGVNPQFKGKVNTEMLLKDDHVRAGFARLAGLMKAGKIGHKRAYYFVWTLERMGVIYNTRNIGDIPWYQWGAEQLVTAQAGNGSWPGGEFGVCDTCFALLFLKRANVAQDLTDILAIRERPKDVKKPKDEPKLDLGGGLIEDPKKGANKGKTGGGRQSFLAPDLRRGPRPLGLEPSRPAYVLLPADRASRFVLRSVLTAAA
jgi:hypothetical protein